MATLESSAPDQLHILLNSLTSTISALPSAGDALLPPVDGISLLDVKNELLLSYLQNLTFLIVLKLRQNGAGEVDQKTASYDEAVKNLVETRVYIDKGVRPLENRLRYQIDKVLRAAEDAERIAVHKKASQVKNPHGVTNPGAEEQSLSESDSEVSTESATQGVDDLSYRPNPAALLRKPDPATKELSKSRKTNSSSSAPYKPPRITPTAMPTNSNSDRQIRKRKSHLLDEYIDAELSTAPQAQPSIGSNNTILNRGRGSMSARDQAKQRERIEYEERNLTRLPVESKAERRKARLRGEGGGKRDMFGGEDWTGLGGLGDRVLKSVGGGTREKTGVLERREKRRRATEDGQRGDGLGIGETFEKRRKVLQGRAEKKGRRSTGR